MRKIFVWALMAILALASAAIASSPPPTGASSVIAMMDTMNTTMATNPLIADDAITIATTLLRFSPVDGAKSSELEQLLAAVYGGTPTRETSLVSMFAEGRYSADFDAMATLDLSTSDATRGAPAYDVICPIADSAIAQVDTTTVSPPSLTLAAAMAQLDATTAQPDEVMKVSIAGANARNAATPLA